LREGLAAVKEKRAPKFNVGRHLEKKPEKK
jgi:hypothetical protein